MHPRQRIYARAISDRLMEQKRAAPEMLRAVKPRLQAIVDDHARARGK